MTTSVLEEAVAAARRGALIVVPTDTVYGVATRPDDPDAVVALFAAKDRPTDLTLPLLVPDLETARAIADLDGRAEILAGACWPGGLTIVAPRTHASATWDLGGDEGTVGVRVPAHPLALELLRRTGPLAVSSANRSGDPPARTCDELVAAFGDRVAVYLCEDEPLEGSASTVVDLAHGDAVVLRAGAVTVATLAELLPGEGSLLDSGPS
jgi:tRNA threonylcarbamoyl adenosine modification protein (Sua5/YciO/YrdC/YwlC family)